MHMRGSAVSISPRRPAMNPTQGRPARRLLSWRVIAVERVGHDPGERVGEPSHRSRRPVSTLSRSTMERAASRASVSPEIAQRPFARPVECSCSQSHCTVYSSSYMRTAIDRRRRDRSSSTVRLYALLERGLERGPGPRRSAETLRASGAEVLPISLPRRLGVGEGGGTMRSDGGRVGDPTDMGDW